MRSQVGLRKHHYEQRGIGILVDLFQILKDDVVKVLHSICQPIWNTQQWPQDWKRSVFISIPRKGNAKECSKYCTTVLISGEGNGRVDKAEIDVFLEFSCFFYDPTDDGNLICGSSAFSKSSLKIWNFTVHVLLKTCLEKFLW